jgi:uncharacterized surface protein with fasciclin (FAS1) repeats
MKRFLVAPTLLATALLGVGIALAAIPQTQVPDKNIVQVAGASKDHTTLVAALKAANYITSLQNPGPFTVFAPTNAAFDKLPKGTLDNLMKPDQQEALRNILKYHVAVPTYKIADFKDGQVIGEANGGKVTMSVKDGVVKVNDAPIVASIVTSNGTIHVIDTVLIPPAAK